MQIDKHSGKKTQSDMNVTKSVEDWDKKQTKVML